MRDSRRVILGLLSALLLLGILWRHRDRVLTEADAPRVEEAEPAPSPAPLNGATAIKAPTGRPESSSTVIAAEKPATVIEGFLIATDVGLAVGEAFIPGEQPLPDAKDAAVKSLLDHIIEPPALEDLPRSAQPDFSEFLAGRAGPESVPQARLRLRVRPTGPTREAPMQRLHVEEILEKEILGDDWLLAWREMFVCGKDLAAARELDPGLEKRNRLLEIATRFAEALARARAARAGDAVVRWRVRREAEACAEFAAAFERFGLRSAVPEAPEPGVLWELAKAASGPAEFRTMLLTRWGPESLLLEVSWSIPVRAEDDNSVIGWENRSAGADEVCAMTPDRFATLQKELRGWDEVAKEDDPQPLPADDVKPRLREIGIAAASLSAGDRERLILEGGARVVSVEPGSVADTAGVRAGDIAWRVRWVAEDGSEVEESRKEQVRHADSLDRFLANRVQPRIALELLRDGRSLTVSILISRAR